jgi:hypothetical protein
MATELDVRTSPEGETFWALAWSPDGRLIAGAMASKGAGSFPAVYDLATQEYTTMPGVARQWLMPAWIDNDTLIVRDESGIYFQQLGGVRRLLIDVGGYVVGRSMGLSRDRKWITYTETGTEGDIWVARLRPGER